MPYIEAVNERYNQLYSVEFELELNGRDSASARKTAERNAQHKAILITFDEMYDHYRNEMDAADIWNAIYAAHMIRKAGHSFKFAGSETDAYRQIGNAVPPVLFWHIAKKVSQYFDPSMSLR